MAQTCDDKIGGQGSQKVGSEQTKIEKNERSNSSRVIGSGQVLQKGSVGGKDSIPTSRSQNHILNKSGQSKPSPEKKPPGAGPQNLTVGNSGDPSPSNITKKRPTSTTAKATLPSKKAQNVPQNLPKPSVPAGPGKNGPKKTVPNKAGEKKFVPVQNKSAKPHQTTPNSLHNSNLKGDRNLSESRPQTSEQKQMHKNRNPAPGQLGKSDSKYSFRSQKVQ